MTAGRLIIVSGTRPCWQLNGDVRLHISATIAKFATPIHAVIMHGDALGVDALARRVATSRGRGHIPMPAQWDMLGKHAGPMRNQAMIDVAVAMHSCGWEIVALCYPVKSSKGTRDMIERLEWRRGDHALTGEKSPRFYPMPAERWLVIVNELEL